jgi:transaldolase
MIGRLDDYLREIFGDSRAAVAEADLQQAGLAAAKRVCAIYAKEGYAARPMIAAFRQTHQVAAMSGAPAVLSIHPKYQKLLTEAPPAREEGFGHPVPPKALEALKGHPEFRRAWEVDGLEPAQFISYGLTQRTLAQFSEAGWRLLESFEPAKGERSNG